MSLLNILNDMLVSNIFTNIYKILVKYFPLLIKGLGMTLLLSLLTVVFGAIVGFLISLLTMSKNKVLKFIGNAKIIKLLFILLLLVSHPVMSDFLQPHGLQHARPPCPLPFPEFVQVHVPCIGTIYIVCYNTTLETLRVEVHYIFFLFYLFFNWRTITSQCCVG